MKKLIFLFIITFINFACSSSTSSSEDEPNDDYSKVEVNYGLIKSNIVGTWVMVSSWGTLSGTGAGSNQWHNLMYWQNNYPTTFRSDGTYDGLLLDKNKQYTITIEKWENNYFNEYPFKSGCITLNAGGLEYILYLENGVLSFYDRGIEQPVYQYKRSN